jgi:sugar O-acyltransferase (sialic acid O-acetyltransferase NeuD family)
MKNSKKDLILIGGGGHCVSVIDVIEQQDLFNIIGVLDSNSKNKNILGYPILGGDNLIPEFVNKNTFFLITVGQIKSSRIRQTISEDLKKNNGKLATIVSHHSYVSKHSSIGEGTIIMNGSIVNANVKIGKNCIINTKSNLEHGVSVGDFCHISTGAIVNGDSIIGKGTFIGSNSTISNNIHLEDNSIISAGKFIKFSSIPKQ